jgi:hypothetical protein
LLDPSGPLEDEENAGHAGLAMPGVGSGERGKYMPGLDTVCPHCGNCTRNRVGNSNSDIVIVIVIVIEIKIEIAIAIAIAIVPALVIAIAIE